MKIDNVPLLYEKITKHVSKVSMKTGLQQLRGWEAIMKEWDATSEEQKED